MADISESDDEEVLADQRLEEITIDTLQGVWRHSNGAYVTIRGSSVKFSSGDQFGPLTQLEGTVDMDGWQPVLAKSTSNRIIWSKAGEDAIIRWSFESDLDDPGHEQEEEIDKSNIQTGKRKRKTVDYKALYEQQKKKRALKKAMRQRGEDVSDDDILDGDSDEEDEAPKKKKKPKEEAEGEEKVDVAAIAKELDQPELVAAEQAIKAIKKLKKAKMDLTILKATKVGLTVNKYRKHSDAEVATTAKALVGEWKGLLKK